MRQSILTTVLVSATLSAAAPLLRRINIDQAATAEAQRRDGGATRAFTAIPIKTSDGQCLAVDPESGDFRRNLMNVVPAKCDGSANQQWDVITKGTHNNVSGQALIVSTSFSNCLNFDPRRAGGNQVILFSCGGRADGDGQVTDSQLFAFDGSKTTLPLVPQNSNRDGTVCLQIINGKLDQTRCNPAQASNQELFTLGNGGSAAAPPPPAPPATTASATSSSAAPPASTAAPAPPVTTIRIDDAATAEAQRRDNGATRAFTAIAIKTNDGKCLSIDPNSGDFRRNLMNVVPAACDGSSAQQFDVITKGTHNNVAGQALIVSSSFLNCLNFDPRRAAGNQVLMFSCGGRADGDGQVTDSQLFAFDGSKTTLPLVPQNSIRDGAVCFSIINGKLDQSACNPAQANANQLFTLGDGSNTAVAAPPATETSVAATSTSSASAAPPATSAPASTAAPAPPASTIRIDEAATAEAQRHDDGATRAFTGAPIVTTDGLCLAVDPNSGDFRRNLMNVVSAPCDGSSAQQFDVITKGTHNNVAGQALIVSSTFLNCLNFDPRRAAGNQVLMFSCGGRADGDGQVTDSQLFAFDGTKTTPLVPQNSIRDGAVCFSIINGKLDQSACNPAQANANQLFTIGNGAPSAPPAAPAPPADAPPAAPPAGNTSPVGTVVLDPAATAEAQQRDNTATRAFSGVPIKVDGKCLTANLNTGDFRQNLIEVDVADCDNSAQQQFDIITAGKHNDQAGQTLIVSSLTQGCLNVDERRQPGNQVLLFSCGGRADGGGQVTNSQLFAFNGQTNNIALVPGNVNKAKCLFDNNGKLDLQACNPASPSGAQTFTIA